MNCCKQCQQKQNKYRILQSDLEFQIKKMSQDLASQKVSLEMQYQKESKRMAERYHRERGEREEENRKWLQKYDQLVEDYEAKIRVLQMEAQERQKEIEGAAASKLTRKEQEIKNTYEGNIETLKHSHQTTITRLHQQFQTECATLKRQSQEEMKRLKKAHQQELTSVTQDYEGKLRQLRSEIIAGAENLDKLKLESHQKQTLLYEQLYQRKQEISGLKYIIDQLNSNIVILQQEVRLKSDEIETIKKEHSEKVAKMQSDFEQEKEVIISELSQQIQSLLRDKLDDCSKFEQVVKDIDVKREHQMKIYATSLKEVKDFVEERPSRQEDLEQITLLKEMLSLKEKEFQQALNEAKGYRLQLNNKEQIFNKIFCSHSPLNIQRIGKRKDSAKMLQRASSTLKDTTNKYHSTTSHTISEQPKKERLVLQPKSSKFF